MEKNNSHENMEGKENIQIKNDNSFTQIKDNNIINNQNHKNELKNGKNSGNEELNENYLNIIDNNPEILFDIITPQKISLWLNKLYNFDLTIISSDNKIYTTIPERRDQNVIKIDAKRTRYKEKKLILGFEKILELILTFYCNAKKIVYKQGLNEIFGALLLMKYKIKDLKLLNILNLGEALIDRFLSNYYRLI